MRPLNEPRVPILIRIRADLKARIAKLATREHRSTNQQIEFLLEHALEQLGEIKDQSASTAGKRKLKGDQS